MANQTLTRKLHIQISVEVDVGLNDPNDSVVDFVTDIEKCVPGRWWFNAITDYVNGEPHNIRSFPRPEQFNP